MKKIVCILTSFCVVGTSFTTSACSFGNMKKEEIMTNIQQAIDSTSLGLRSYIVAKNDGLDQSTIMANQKTLDIDTLLNTSKYPSNYLFSNFLTDESNSNVFDSNVSSDWKNISSGKKPSTNVSSTLTLINEMITVAIPFSPNVIDELISMMSEIMPTITSLFPNILDKNSIISKTLFSNSFFNDLSKSFTSLNDTKSLTYDDATWIGEYEIFCLIHSFTNNDTNNLPIIKNSDKISGVKNLKASNGETYRDNFDNYKSSDLENDLNYLFSNSSSILNNFISNLTSKNNDEEGYSAAGINGVLILFNYILQFFDEKNYPIIESPKTFNNLFSNDKNNGEVRKKILDSNFKNGITITNLYNVIKSLTSSNYSNNGASLAKILSILFDNSSTSYNPISDILGYILSDVLNKLLNPYGKVIEPIIMQILNSLSKNYSISGELSEINGLIDMLSGDMQTILKDVLSILSNYPSIYNKKQSIDTAPSNNENFSSQPLGLLWDYKNNLLGILLNKIDKDLGGIISNSDFSYLLNSNNLQDLISNLLNNVEIINITLNNIIMDVIDEIEEIYNNKVDIRSIDFKSEGIKNILMGISGKNKDSISDSTISNLDDNDLSTWEYVYKKFWNNSLDKGAKESPLLKKLIPNVDFSDEKTTYNALKKYSIFIFPILCIADPSIGSSYSAMTLFGYQGATENNLESSFIKGSPFYKLENTISNNLSIGIFLISFISDLFKKFITQISQYIYDNFTQYVADPKYWEVKNIEYKINNYKNPSIIKYELIYNDYLNNKQVSYNITIKLFTKSGTNANYYQVDQINLIK